MPSLYYIIPMEPWSLTSKQHPQYVDEIRCNWSGYNVDLFGVYVCLVNTTDAKHIDLASRTGVFQLPSEYNWNTVISTMQAAARNFIRNLCNNRLGIAYSTSETLGELLMRIINSGLFELGSVDPETQFQNLNTNQQTKILAAFAHWGMSSPNVTDTVRQISSRGGEVWWSGGDRKKVNVEEY